MESGDLWAVEGDDVDFIEYFERLEPSQTPTLTTVVALPSLVPPPLGTVFFNSFEDDFDDSDI
ncbi:hypothetical protein MUK42_27586 [Musa troglodytarum]|uniref:Uncharacterized protein n=1 Tax=Musa troglodytarum TaxID=320322 RepID=A0A9E7F2H2_9LILI|nr:hypothetical protein MUK42_27586 [Musa troglodytarum]